MRDDQKGKNTLNSDCGCGGAQSGDDDSVDTSRRRFATATMAAPIVSTLISRPVWGMSCQPTGMLSGDLSHPHDDQCTGGCTPGYWKNNVEVWDDTHVFMLPDGTSLSSGQCDTTEMTGSGKCKQWDSSSGTLWMAVFGFPASIADAGDPPISSPTLLEVMLYHNLTGWEGTYENHVVAALLNYFYKNEDVTTFICLVKYYGGVVDNCNGVAPTMTKQEFFNKLVEMNESGCFMDAFGYCSDDVFVTKENKCIPACPDGCKYDQKELKCVAKNSI